MTQWGRLAMYVSALASVALGARAASPAGAEAATQVVGLFMQSCVRFGGDVAGLRKWAVGIGMQPLPAAGQRAFLRGVPGEALDASTPQDKLVLISADAGTCSTAAETASGSQVVQLLEQAMRLSRIDFALTREDDNQEESDLHHRTYAVSRGDRQWDLLVSTVKGAAAGEVMLTARP